MGSNMLVRSVLTCSGDSSGCPEGPMETGIDLPNEAASMDGTCGAVAAHVLLCVSKQMITVFFRNSSQRAGARDAVEASMLLTTDEGPNFLCQRPVGPLMHFRIGQWESVEHTGDPTVTFLFATVMTACLKLSIMRFRKSAAISSVCNV